MKKLNNEPKVLLASGQVIALGVHKMTVDSLANEVVLEHLGVEYHLDMDKATGELLKEKADMVIEISTLMREYNTNMSCVEGALREVPGYKDSPLYRDTMNYLQSLMDKSMELMEQHKVMPDIIYAICSEFQGNTVLIDAE